MNKDEENNKTLDDLKIHVKFKISALWIAVMFIYVYADIKVFFQPGIITAIQSGKVAGMEINQIFLLGSAIIMAIPSLMIFLSLILKPKINRLLNIIFGIVYTLIIMATLFSPGDGKIWLYYILYNTIEIILTISIVSLAWRWPKKCLSKNSV